MVMKKILRVFVAIGTLCVAGATVECTSDIQSVDVGPSDVLAVPPRTGFEVVADAMQLHCGTLDCHGQVGQDMRLYGQYGLRLIATFDPLTEPTDPTEYDATYQAIVGLEPEAMSRVVQNRAPADSLSLIRKPSGIEGHQGGELFLPGDPLDRCILGWVTGTIDFTACATVSGALRPSIVIDK
jgi:hypothetical protein